MHRRAREYGHARIVCQNTPAPRPLPPRRRRNWKPPSAAPVFYHNKAKAIQGASRLLLEKHSGSVPDTMEELLELPGVARKTANVVLGNAFAKNEGVVVDTHVGRLSQRLGLTAHSQPEKIEGDLMALFPREQWTMLAHLLISLGRGICLARKPACDRCPVATECPKVGVTAGAKA